MTAQKTNTENTSSKPSTKSLGFDPHEFFHFLDETGWSDDQKAQYVSLVWNIVCEFAAMGWGVHPIQQAMESCGKPVQPPVPETFDGGDVVNLGNSKLIEEFMRRNEGLPASGAEGVIDE